ncbi:hypothetical protein Syun_001277 [Stephania yunnanensis]|uniref:Uncharacterized protein n=1 Tax=Stephania yunnanensis TaxID=152371 RepID=A0AAP0LDF4_9MAGN
MPCKAYQCRNQGTKGIIARVPEARQGLIRESGEVKALVLRSSASKDKGVLGDYL